MNKSLIVLLAVCLISVHAFVKRDAPAPAAENDLKKFQDQVQDLAKQFNDKASEILNSETIKKNFNDLVDTIKSAIDGAKSEPPKQ